NIVAKDKKRAFLKHAGEVILEKVFVDGVDQEGFSNAKAFVESSLNVVAADDAVLEMLKALNSHSDFIYAHSLGVSTYSVMIARALGWRSAPSLFKVAMAGLFHDIGFKELDR